MKSLLLALLVCQFSLAEIFTYGVIGDAGVWNSKTQAIQNSMIRGGISRLILPGDNIYDVKLEYEDVWSHWKKRGFSFDVVALGNHFKSYAEEMAYFEMPAEYFKVQANPELAFLVLNSDNPENVSEQFSWLKSQLASSEEKILILVFHHPPYTVSERHSWKEKQFFHQNMRPLLQKHRKKIDLVIVGHDHIETFVDVGGLPLIVAGASHEAFPAKPVSYKAEDGVSVKTRWLYEGDAHWARLDIDTEAETLWVNFVQAVQGKVVCSFLVKPSGTWIKDNCL